MKTAIIFTCLFTVTALFAQMNVALTFSTDGGKTWNEDFPVLTDGKREFLVKATWKVVSEKPMKIITTRLACRERDFASANMGRRNELGKMKQNAWLQSLTKYWANPASPTPFLYRVDLGERKAGTIGMLNEWSREQKKFINAPLPPLAAFGPGTCRFTVLITCWGKKNGERVFEAYQDFDVIIQK